MITSKICSKCNQELSIDNFHKSTNNKDGFKGQCKKCRREYNAIYVEEAKEKIFTMRKQYRENNKEILSIKKKEYYKNNKEEHKKRMKEYIDKNKAELYRKKKIYREENKERLLAQRKLYRQTPEARIIKRVSNFNRKVLERKAGKLDNDEVKKIVNNAKKCYWCGTSIKKSFHIDHYVPLSKGGTNAIENIVISCPQCNMKKHNTDPLKFAQSIGKLF